MMTPQVAQAIIGQNVITRCIGAPEGVRADFYAVPPSGRFMICSDGLHGQIEDSLIASISAAGKNPELVVEQLIQASLNAGGDDNVTVLVVDLMHRRGHTKTQDDERDWRANKLEDQEDFEYMGHIDDQTLDAILAHG